MDMDKKQAENINKQIQRLETKLEKLRKKHKFKEIGETIQEIDRLKLLLLEGNEWK